MATPVELGTDLFLGLDLGRVLDEAPGPAALEELVLVREAFLDVDTEDEALADDGAQGLEAALELLQDHPLGQPPLAEEFGERSALRGVHVEDVDGERTQQTHHGRRQPDTGGRPKFLDEFQHLGAARLRLVDLEEAEGGEAEGDRHRVAVHHAEFTLFGSEVLGAVAGVEVVTAREGRSLVVPGVVAHELGRRRQHVHRDLQ